MATTFRGQATRQVNRPQFLGIVGDKSGLSTLDEKSPKAEHSNLSWMLYTCRLLTPYRHLQGRLALLGVLCLILVLTFVCYRILPSALGGFDSSDEDGSLLRHSSINGRKRVVYGVVFDAGSTGSRIHVFRFRHNAKPATGQEKFQLLSEDFQHVKPGLSAYANDPKKAAASLAPLIKIAEKRIPKSEWSHTLTVLKATAGLRLLPKTAADGIIREVNSTLRRTGLLLADSKAVSIMDGREEGLCSWLTLNYVAERLAYPSSTFGALDLGGGSTQITFLPVQHQTLAGAPKGFIVKAPVKRRMFDFYTNSYLGLGLMSARHQLMQGSENGKEEPTLLGSPCLPPNYKGVWHHHGKEYKVETTGLNGFHACYDSAKALVTELYSVDSQREIRQRRFFAFSYFFDRAQDAGLIAKGSPGRVVLVKEYLQAAEKECSTNTEKDPYLCMDLCYMSALFLHGYTFREESQLHVMKRLNGVELSWSLGLMVQLMYVIDAQFPADAKQMWTRQNSL